ncbi:MAG: GNAT family N-acetyltransferase [Flavisolibacter sp.]|nr:GNAT family N-acetyltransferase [Flavisolibacter sp.]
MEKELYYRQGAASDLKQLKELGIASYGQYATVLTPEHWQKLNRSLNDEKALLDLLVKSTSFVCVDGDTIVGMAYLIPSGNPTDIYQEDWCYIRMVGVHPDYTGRGIARKLTQMCIEKAKDLNEKTIALHTSEFMDAARHIYESIGFIVFKEIPPRLGKRYWLYTLDIS